MIQSRTVILNALVGLAAIFTPTFVHATERIELGTRLTLPSRILNEDRVLLIYLPVRSAHRSRS